MSATWIRSISWSGRPGMHTAWKKSVSSFWIPVVWIAVKQNIVKAHWPQVTTLRRYLLKLESTTLVAKQDAETPAGLLLVHESQLVQHLLVLLPFPRCSDKEYSWSAHTGHLLCTNWAKGTVQFRRLTNACTVLLPYSGNVWKERAKLHTPDTDAFCLPRSAGCKVFNNDQ